MNEVRRYLVAMGTGVVLVWAVFATLALVAAIPGLGLFLRALKSSGLPSGLFTLVVTYLPMPLVAFATGTVLVKFVRGIRFRHLAVCAVPWVLNGVHILADVWTEVDLNWSHEAPGLLLVPVGVLLAALMRPASGRASPGERLNASDANIPTRIG